MTVVELAGFLPSGTPDKLFTGWWLTGNTVLQNHPRWVPESWCHLRLQLLGTGGTWCWRSTAQGSLTQWDSATKLKGTTAQESFPSLIFLQYSLLTKLKIVLADKSKILKRSRFICIKQEKKKKRWIWSSGAIIQILAHFFFFLYCSANPE